MALEYAQELVGLVEKARAAAIAQDKKTAELNERETLLNIKESDLNLRKASLDAREAQIVPIENVILFKKDAQALLDNAYAEREKLAAEKAEYAKQVQSTQGQIEEDRKLAKREADNNETNRNNIEAIALKRAREILAQFGHAELAAKI